MLWYKVISYFQRHLYRYDWEDPFLSSLLEEKFMESFLHHNSHSMEETMLFCRYQGVVLPCSEIFEVVGTDSGVYNAILSSLVKLMRNNASAFIALDSFYKSLMAQV